MSVWMTARHTCDDYDTWRTAFESGRSLRQEHGSTDEMVFRSGNDVLVLLEFPDASSQSAFEADPRVSERRRASGMIGDPEVTGPWERMS